ncbi:MAG: fused MFS/spermidine synthase [Victivallaceae bacterium]|nr:fused MFS/spermidine synthase [Victivallaceae bacterium]
MRKFIILLFIIISNSSFAGDGVWQSIYNFFVPHQEQQKVLFKTETKYFNIEVREDSNKLRHLVFLPYHGSQSTWDPQQPDKIFSPSLKTLCATLAVTPQLPKKYLFLGMGAGIMPRFILRHFPEAEIDIVELDPAVPKIAEKYFGYKPNDKTTIITADARVYVNQCKKRYDVIIVDVYNAKAVPFAVTTQEFFSRLKECLNPKGVVGVNLANLGNKKFLVSELFTISQVFNHLLIYACPDNSNFIPIFSADSPITAKAINTRIIEMNKQYRFEFNLSAWLGECTVINDVNRYFDVKPVFITDGFAL